MYNITMMMNHDNISHLREIFDECDENQSGYINKDQLRELVAKITSTGLEEEELDTLMKTLDTDNDGQIGFQEFVDGYNLIDPELLLDDDDDDDETNFKKIMDVIQTDRNNNSTSNSIDTENILPPSPIDYEKYLREIFNQYDDDGDGIINNEQLRTLLADIKDKSGIEGDDEDVDYIVQVLNNDGKDTITFENFITAIEHINSPSQESPTVSSFEPSISDEQQQQQTVQSATLIDLDSNDDQHNHHQQNNQQQHNQDEHINEHGESSGFSSSRNNSSFRSGVRGRASSWVAPVSIVNMIKKRAEMFAKEENTQVYTDASVDPNVFVEYKRKEALLRSENEHLGSKINMVEDQLREVRESHEKLSEDNAQLKESVVIGKKTLVQNQKLASQNKQLEETIEVLKSELMMATDARNELQRTHNKLKQHQDGLLVQLETATSQLSLGREKMAELEEQHAKNAPLLKKAHSFQQFPPQEIEQMREENVLLKQQLEKEQSKAQDSVKLLSEEYALLKKKSKEDKALLDSSNQIIHKLKQTLEEQQGRTHNSDPNYKLSLLSELEQQVVTRLGTPGTLDYGSTSSLAAFDVPITPASTPTNGSEPIAIAMANGRTRPPRPVDHDDDSLDSLSEDAHNERIDELQQRNDQLEKERVILDQQVKTLQEMLDTSSSQIKMSTVTIEEKEKEIVQAKQSMEQTKNEIEQTKKEMEQTKKEMEQTKLDMEQTKRVLEERVTLETKTLQDQIHELTMSNAEMTQTMLASSSTLEMATGQVSELRQQLEKKVEVAERLSEENRLLKSQIDTSGPAPIDPVHIKAEQTQGELLLLKQRVEELASKNNSLVSENSQLKEQQSFSPLTSPTTSKRDIHEQEEIQDKVESNENQIGGTSAVLLSETSQHSINDLHSQVSTLTDIKDQLEKDLKKYQKMQADTTTAQVANSSLVDQLQKETQALKSNGQKLDEKYRIVEYQFQQATDQCNELKEQNQTLQERIEMIKLEYETKVSQSNSHFEKKNKIIKENEELKQRLKRYESEDHQIDIIEMEDETKTLRVKVEDLSNRLQNERNLNKHLQSQLDHSDQSPLIPGGGNSTNSAYHNRRQCCGLC
ncbi:hypothetical protein DFA_07970 [Cavenderia fasciculata]|uniref:EF-hand domain-containing protein n=1 Tax=Cavenderia fasciculata TaxID=261658 RepID=F4Q4C7_CACFS|nr:uncharacterized protein DFA_07970 [Cavenderia fasciculata]EGG16989.1 hypothetical protein DFA_07970 [Cavenderia fasciculata]|eukprot:XP_004355473.1 hypothetical protein DFA_07970 [Cavenderia fasciculata]